MYQRILVSTDGSELSQKAASHALQLAKSTGASLIALTVTPAYPVTYLEGSMPINAEQAKEIEAKWRAESQQYVHSIQEDGAKLGVLVTPVIVNNDNISDAILETAKEQGADLIVMASHGRKGIARLLLGSETQHVLTNANIPVLVLR
ncbi:Nucleotide-binding universal stress protein, UspA family [Lampropedia hyalina DSM 16112]|jgi:nucleotide-binding universal stress UspA family protein|uniref:Universal stress protein n=1 Tax=Lampropedia hyalina DSM 16112 TaxID=1122156 RepID=A0A1M5BSV4_9BURK|nr:universal stress protein [Lampropedia hyalina]SHF45609.1 Nucleotide-binding universal stress protein, UspA family [Lampropedia hyalina DSM 16112]